MEVDEATDEAAIEDEALSDDTVEEETLDVDEYPVDDGDVDDAIVGVIDIVDEAFVVEAAEEIFVAAEDDGDEVVRGVVDG